MADLTPRTIAWAATMGGFPTGELIAAHRGSAPTLAAGSPIDRLAREEVEAAQLRDGAALAQGAGDRAIQEEPDPERTCFERDRDRIIHSSAFRRLAGKTQVVVFPTDHQRTRLTHALEVAQVATSIARGVGANVSLTEAIALGHDCGHGPGGHASEDAFDAFLPEGYEHGPWGADVVLAGLNLCSQTLDGIRNHSWSRPTPLTVEGEIVSWADRIAYCAHDLEDAIRAGIVTSNDLPEDVIQVAGVTLRDQLRVFIRSVIEVTTSNGRVGMDATIADALVSLRAFNYERIYVRKESLAQSTAVIELLRALVEYYLENPLALPADQRGKYPTHDAVKYVAGMTDRYAFDQAVALLSWDPDRLPKSVSS